MKIRTIIVDDEPLARSRITNLLQDHDEVQIVGQCRNGREAVDSILKNQPELIFLDIQMPDISGFKVISEMNLNYQPIIIFATAYDKYALKAFDVHAIDYLLKPFDKERFAEAIDRAKRQIKFKKSSEFNERLVNMLNDYNHTQNKFLSSFCLKEDGRLRNIPVEEVYCIEADGNYITLNLASKNYLYRATMNDIEEQLDPQYFLRIHRSTILNLRYIEKVKYLQNNEYLFILKNDSVLTSGRSFKDKIVEALNYSSLI